MSYYKLTGEIEDQNYESKYQKTIATKGAKNIQKI
jgi:hypothetical protein